MKRGSKKKNNFLIWIIVIVLVLVAGLIILKYSKPKIQFSPADNLILNPSFDSWNWNTLNSWSAPSSYIARNRADKVSGTYSTYLERDNYGYTTGQEFNVVPGENYTFEIYMKRLAGNDNVWARVVNPYAGGNYRAWSWQKVHNHNLNSWYKKSMTFTVPSGITKIRIEIGGGTNVTALFDEARLIKLASTSGDPSLTLKDSDGDGYSVFSSGASGSVNSTAYNGYNTTVYLDNKQYVVEGIQISIDSQVKVNGQNAIINSSSCFYLNDGNCIQQTFVSCTSSSSGGGCYSGFKISLGKLDCNDNNNFINPGAAEVCYDNIDNNCDGYIDDNGGNSYLCTSYNLKCADSDGGDNPSSYGNVTLTSGIGSTVKLDKCWNSTLLAENYCPPSNLTIISVNYTCSNCLNGAGSSCVREGTKPNLIVYNLSGILTGRNASGYPIIKIVASVKNIGSIPYTNNNYGSNNRIDCEARNTTAVAQYIDLDYHRFNSSTNFANGFTINPGQEVSFDCLPKLFGGSWKMNATVHSTGTYANYTKFADVSIS